ncbi:porin family protein [Cohaesibacter sp. CAU 1516]|uniref:outer membrane protein n=1 Tax=Cohaesibacter sp. CAU 1516 TaxID=2576038 RepID=UPI0010FF59E1|nr:outer membrane beta-barrel protein [Cohaesibacter sp. CAU 1516]TLP43142.1 porin family protein [Cohaesibacter sp. CAU 1516]
MTMNKDRTIARCARAALLASTVSILGLAAPANSADMGQVFGTKSAYDWSGLYMGVQFGMGTGKVNSSDGTNKVSERFSQGDNTTGGVLVGWNYQTGNIVYGLEGGLSINEIKANHNGSTVAYHNSDYVWHAEARGKVGYSLGRFLPYVHAGVLAGEFYQQSAPGATSPSAKMKTVYGYTAGAGIDVRIGPKISLRSEYVYQNYGKQNYYLASVPTTLKSDFDVHIARAALLYHFGNPITQSDEPTSNALLFAGPSFGVNVATSTGDVKLGGYSSGNFSLDTISAGATVGYLYPINDFRVGAEAELAMHSGSESTNPGGLLTSLKYRLMWHAAVRGKVGYVFENYMPYVMAGANLGQFTTSSQPNNNTNLDPYKNGYSVGAGFEYAISDHLSADVAYSYNTYKKTGVDTSGSVTKVGHDFHQVRFGLTVR